jgi:hypothetical protein
MQPDRVSQRQPVTLFCRLVTGTLTGTLVGGLLAQAACGQGDSAILATLGPAPARTSQITVTATLDGKPAMTPLHLTSADDRFGVDLPPTTTGQLMLNAQALDTDGCQQGSSTGSVTLPSGRYDLAMPLVPSSPRKCGNLPPCAANHVCALPAAQPSTIQSIWTISPTDIWAVGLNTLLLHYDGQTWTSYAGSSVNLYAVWASASNDVWAAGDTGTILHYDGKSWSSSPNPTIQRLFGLWGVDNKNIWAVGEAPSSTSQGAFLHYDGTTWSSVIDPALQGTTGRFNSVWADNPKFVYACGVKGLLVRYNGTSWNVITSNTTADLHSIWGTPGGVNSSVVFATGDNGLILSIKYAVVGSSWSAIPVTGTSSTLYGVHGDGSSVVYAVGTNGAVVRADGPGYDTFTAQTSTGQVNTLFAVHTASNGITWLGGVGGSLGYLDLRP